MKADTILAIGAIVAGGYLVYKLTKPLTETTQGIGESVTDVSGNISGLTNPMGAYGRGAGDVIETVFGKINEYLKNLGVNNDKNKKSSGKSSSGVTRTTTLKPGVYTYSPPSKAPAMISYKAYTTPGAITESILKPSVSLTKYGLLR